MSLCPSLNNNNNNNNNNGNNNGNNNDNGKLIKSKAQHEKKLLEIIYCSFR